MEKAFYIVMQISNVSFIIIILNSQRSMIFIQAIRLANINIKTIKRVISYLEELA